MFASYKYLIKSKKTCIVKTWRYPEDSAPANTQNGNVQCLLSGFSNLAGKEAVTILYPPASHSN